MISDASILNGKKAMLMMWKSWIIRDCTPDHLAEHRTPHTVESGVSLQMPLLSMKRNGFFAHKCTPLKTLR